MKSTLPPVGLGGVADGDVLTVDSTAPRGVSWQTPSGGPGSGDSVEVNGSATTDVDLDDASPAAPAGSLNVVWQSTGASPTSVSASVKTDNTSIEINSAALRRAALTGDVTAAAGSNATTIANDAVTDAKLRNSGARSVIGRAANSSGDPADISGGGANQVLADDGSTLAFTAFATLLLTAMLATNSHPGFGDGADGSATLSGAGPATEEGRYTDLNVDAAVTYGAHFAIRCTGTLSFDATTSILDHSGASAVTTTGGAGAAAGALSLWQGANGANGRNTVGNGTIGNNSTNSLAAMCGPASGGSSGAGGTSNAGNAGGGAGTATEPSALVGRGFYTGIIENGSTLGSNVQVGLRGGAGGGSGGCTPGGGTAASGSGGGGAGIVIVWARQVDTSGGVGKIQANGGNGSAASAAAGGQAGGGGGGGGGAAVLVYTKLTGSAPTVTATKGTGGGGAGGGASGGDGVDGFAHVRVIL